MVYRRSRRPRGRRYNRTGKSRNNRRRYKSNRRNRYTDSVQRFGTTVPARMFVKMRYSEKVTFSAGSSNAYSFSGNSVFDPNVSGIGGQPLSLDQWNGFYLNYRVRSSKCTVVVNAQGAGAGSVRRYALIPYNATQAAVINTTPISTLSEYPGCRVWYGNTNTGSGAIKGKSSYARSAKVFNVTSTTLNSEENYSALFTANPVNTWQWFIRSEATDSISSPESPLYVTVTYYVELFNRRALGAS